MTQRTKKSCALISHWLSSCTKLDGLEGEGGKWGGGGGGGDHRSDTQIKLEIFSASPSGFSQSDLRTNKQKPSKRTNKNTTIDLSNYHQHKSVRPDYPELLREREREKKRGGGGEGGEG